MIQVTENRDIIKFTKEKLISLICDIKPTILPSKIKDNSLLFQHIGLTSFDIVILLCELEEHYNLRVPINESCSITTVDELFEYIVQYGEQNTEIIRR